MSETCRLHFDSPRRSSLPSKSGLNWGNANAHVNTEDAYIPIRHGDRAQALVLALSLSGSYMHARTHTYTLGINNCFDFDFLSKQNKPWFYELTIQGPWYVNIYYMETKNNLLNSNNNGFIHFIAGNNAHSCFTKVSFAHFSLPPFQALVLFLISFSRIIVFTRAISFLTATIRMGFSS